MNKRRFDILERTAEFCNRCIQVALTLDEAGGSVSWELSRQLVRCGGSVGANIEEAQATTTKNDFAYRMSVALRESREARFWLRRIRDNALLLPERLEGLLQESEEIVAILTSIVRNARGQGV